MENYLNVNYPKGLCIIFILLNNLTKEFLYHTQSLKHCDISLDFSVNQINLFKGSSCRKSSSGILFMGINSNSVSSSNSTNMYLNTPRQRQEGIFLSTIKKPQFHI